MNGKGDKWRGGWSTEYQDNFNNIFRKENKMKEIVRDALYQFIAYYKQEEIDRLDLRIIADRFVDEEYDCVLQVKNLKSVYKEKK